MSAAQVWLHVGRCEEAALDKERGNTAYKAGEHGIALAAYSASIE